MHGIFIRICFYISGISNYKFSHPFSESEIAKPSGATNIERFHIDFLSPGNTWKDISP